MKKIIMNIFVKNYPIFNEMHEIERNIRNIDNSFEKVLNIPEIDKLTTTNNLAIVINHKIKFLSSQKIRIYYFLLIIHLIHLRYSKKFFCDFFKNFFEQLKDKIFFQK